MGEKYLKRILTCLLHYCNKLNKINMWHCYVLSYVFLFCLEEETLQIQIYFNPYIHCEIFSM